MDVGEGRLFVLIDTTALGRWEYRVTSPAADGEEVVLPGTDGAR